MSELLELEALPLVSELLLLLPAVVSVLEAPVAAVEPLDVEPTWAEPDELPLMLPLALPETPLVVVSVVLLDEAGVVSELLRVSWRLQPAKPSVRPASADTKVIFN